MKLSMGLAACALWLCHGAGASPLGDGVAADRLLPSKRAVPVTHVLHERHTPGWENYWTKRDRLPSDLLLPMRIGLKHPDDILQAGHDRLMEISDPFSPSYGQHMTAEEVIDFFAPHEDSVNAVINWLVDAGIARERIGHSVNKQWIQFDAKVDEVEDLLYAEYHVWEHAASESTDVSCEEYHVPSHVQEHIDYVTPGIRMRSSPKKRQPVEMDEQAGDLTSLSRRESRNDGPKMMTNYGPTVPHLNSTNCDEFVRTECMRATYGIPVGQTAHPGNQLGVYETYNDHWSRADLDTYWRVMYPEIPQGSYPEDCLIDGAAGPAGNYTDPAPLVGTETQLDLETAWPLIWPQKTVYFGVDDQYIQGLEYNYTSFLQILESPLKGMFNTFLDAIDGSYCTYSAYGETGDCTTSACGDPVYPDDNTPGGYTGQLQCGVYKPTNVINLSYGQAEWYLPGYYMKRQCNEWMKLGLQGVTILTGSGDSGVGIQFNNGEPGWNGTCLGPNFDIFSPWYMATCPYVLVVGGTQFVKPDPADCANPYKMKEVPSEWVWAGSGFSNVFPRPEYQKTAVANYLDTTKLPFTSYSAFPDQNLTFYNHTTGLFNRAGRAYPDVAGVADYYLVRYNESWWTLSGVSIATPMWSAALTLVNEARLTAGKSTLGFVNPTLYAHPEAFNDITEGAALGCNKQDYNHPAFLSAPGWDPVTGLGTLNYPKLFDVLMQS